MELSTNAAIIILLLSGGGNPATNNYSQYLQAKLINEHFNNKPGIELTTLFGSGLTPESPPEATPDVAKKEEFEGDIRFVRGEIPNNKAARLENVQTYFSELKKRKWKKGDRFILIVANHGMPNPWDPASIRLTDDDKIAQNYQNNCINLWRPGIDLYPEKDCLSVESLKEMIRDNIPSDVPVAFTMSQCYSGAFHELGYSRDEEGFPQRNTDACGFTSITRDTTAAGCTPFVEEDLYDGYERRIAEAMTGKAVLSGKSIGDPVSSLLDAHKAAAILDNTKDRPLRTSESYILDYVEAHEKSLKEKEDKLAFRDELNEIWLGLAHRKSPLSLKLSPTLKTDLEKRLTFIEELKLQLTKWHKIHQFALEGANLTYLSQMREGVSLIIEKLSDKKDNLRGDYKKMRSPVQVGFILDLNKKKAEEAKESLEFQKLGDMDLEVVYSRLLQEDASLKKMERFLSFVDNYHGNLLKWAEKRDDIKKSDLEKLRRLKVQTETVGREILNLSILKGELERLEDQMIVSSMTGWLANNLKIKALSELVDIVKCESEARLLP